MVFSGPSGSTARAATRFVKSRPVQGPAPNVAATQASSVATIAQARDYLRALPGMRYDASDPVAIRRTNTIPDITLRPWTR